MLEGYYCKDSESTPEYPNEENYLGSFNLAQFKLLDEASDYAQKAGFRIHFFEDFRLKNEEVAKLLKFSKSTLKEINDDQAAKRDAYKRLVAVLRKASEKETGAMFFCD